MGVSDSASSLVGVLPLTLLGCPQVYIETQPLIRSVVDGYNVCIFAYGQTGSGKTHTMSGTHVDKLTGRGINYRALDDLFDLQHSRRAEVKYDIRVQMLEVYNEKVRMAGFVSVMFYRVRHAPGLLEQAIPTDLKGLL